ncbi:MAG TPA: glycosyltransferase family 4 protein [Acidimicrobiales bacterium]|nr:glycosyltransferase family 4 protein [Acidimicrobiales bacterium]
MTKFLPLPDNNGGLQRSLAIARRLAALGDLVICGYDDGTADREGLRDLGIDVRAVPWRVTPTGVARGVVVTQSLSAGRFWSPALAEAVRSAAGEEPLDLLQVEYQQLVPLARHILAKTSVLDLHNVESALVDSYARARRGVPALLFRAEAAALRRQERRTIGTFDHVVVVSEQERGRLTAAARSVLVCPNGREPSAVLPPSPEPTVAFVATMGWAPNVDAAVWLSREIWPLVTARVPEARLLLVGRDPAQAVRDLAGPNVDVTGTVPDVAPYLAQARVVVAPLRAGGGTRLKIMEALDAGRPVVATTVGCEGMEDLVGRGVVVADSATALAGAIAGLLDAPDRATALGLAGHDAVKAEHTWDVALAPLLQAVRPC